MKKEFKLYVCKHCGNIIEKVVDKGVPVICCGEPMKELEANTSDGALEKHVPEVEVSKNTVKVVVGAVEHPMLEAHHIAWVVLVTDAGVYRKDLAVDGAPKAEFLLSEGETPSAVYEYCNLHGLWKKDI